MKPLHTKQDVINLATANAPTKAWQQAMRHEGMLEVFRVPVLSGWIVRVVKHNEHDKGLTARLIGVWADEIARRYRITYPDVLPPGAIRVEGNRL